MSALVWSVPARRASLAALPSPRASTAGESAVAAEAWLLSGEEDRFSTMRSLLDATQARPGVTLSVGVWLPRVSALVVAPAKITGGAGVAQPSVVRSARPAVVRAPLADAEDGLRPHVLRRQAGDRRREHVERDQPVPHAPARARGGRQARRLAGRRVSVGGPRAVAERTVHEAVHDALPQ